MKGVEISINKAPDSMNEFEENMIHHILNSSEEALTPTKQTDALISIGMSLIATAFQGVAQNRIEECGFTKEMLANSINANKARVFTALEMTLDPDVLYAVATEKTPDTPQ